MDGVKEGWLCDVDKERMPWLHMGGSEGYIL